MRSVRTFGLVLLAVVTAAPAHALSLKDRFSLAAQRVGLQGGGAFDALGEAIADTAARNLPVISSSAGFTYQYNPQLEVFERTSETLGPLFLERPDTLGRGKFNVNVSYQYVDLNQLDGDETSSLEGPDPIVIAVTDVAGTPLGFTANRLRYDFNLVNHIAALSFTYGVLDNLDVNVLVPLIHTRFDVAAETQTLFAADVGGPFNPAPGPVLRGAPSRADKTGVGDIFLRAKYQLPRLGDWRSAAGLQLRLPSGEEDDFQGTGSFEASPFLYLSTVMWGRVEPHANLGVDLNADDVEASQGRYGLGVDVDVHPRVGLALAFLGRSQFTGSASADETDFLHLTGGGLALRPLLGVDFDRKDFFDLAFGARFVVWRQIMLFANGIYALNDDGLRNDTIIPTAGVEGTF
ncbi:MAG TPA: transporter [Candidatus Binatia bacterium]|nr:transporter [Candidatus Binatia bacterium]